MKGTKIITLMCATALLSSCHIYKAYDRPEDITTEGLYRDTALVNTAVANDTASFESSPTRSCRPTSNRPWPTTPTCARRC